MTALTSHPLVLLCTSFVLLCVSASIGAVGFKKLRSRVASLHEDFAVVQGATLTLLGLIIGFTFSMAVTRYDQRKDFEEQEANAIGTEYARADFLPQDDAVKVRALLLSYLEQRIAFYTSRDERELDEINARTAKLQKQLWSAVQVPATANATPVMALAVAGMNDVLNTQGYTQAAWANRIPFGAWSLMLLIAVCATMLVGVGTRDARAGSGFLVVLPLVLSIAFFLIADIDTPRRGVIRVVPQNLHGLAQSLRTQ